LLVFKTVIRWIPLNLSAENFPAGPPVVRYAAGKKICVLKTEKGIFAIEEKCPHNGFSLAQGKCTEDGEAIVCPLHRYAYDLKTGRCRNSSGGAARVFPVEVREGSVFIGVEETQWGWW
jgi:nitrite reductase/ring-hydroxylating ferredoxin subunit